MKQRVITGIIFGIIVLSLLLFHDYGRLALLVLIPVLSIIEYSKMTKFSFVDWSIYLFISAALFCCLYLTQINTIYLLIIISAINILLIANLFVSEPFIKHTKFKSIISAVYISGPFMIAYFLKLHASFSVLLIAIMILIWVSDSSAYFVGSQIGKRKLFPSISPKKTWEGFYGAGMCVFIFAYVIFSISQFKEMSFWLFFAMIIWVLGAIGDLIASHVKRLHTIKDSGSLLPGHGGFYDRFDAFIFVLPFILLLNEIVPQ